MNSSTLKDPIPLYILQQVKGGEELDVCFCFVFHFSFDEEIPFGFLYFVCIQPLPCVELHIPLYNFDCKVYFLGFYFLFHISNISISTLSSLGYLWVYVLVWGPLWGQNYIVN